MHTSCGGFAHGGGAHGDGAQSIRKAERATKLTETLWTWGHGHENVALSSPGFGRRVRDWYELRARRGRTDATDGLRTGARAGRSYGPFRVWRIGAIGKRGRWTMNLTRLSAPNLLRVLLHAARPERTGALSVSVTVSHAGFPLALGFANAWRRGFFRPLTAYRSSSSTTS